MERRQEDFSAKSQKPSFGGGLDAVRDSTQSSQSDFVARMGAIKLNVIGERA